MKKLVLFAVAAVAISFASCGNKSAENAAQDAADSIAAQVEDVKIDADSLVQSVDSLVNEVKEEVK